MTHALRNRALRMIARRYRKAGRQSDDDFRDITNTFDCTAIMNAITQRLDILVEHITRVGRADNRRACFERQFFQPM